MTETVTQNDVQETITRRAFFLVALWAAGILLLYAIGGYLGVRQLEGYRAETEKFRQAWIEGATTETGAPAPGFTLAPGVRPVDVRVGIYINRIGEFSLKEAGWTADFDIRFRWTGDQVNPGENFQVVNGQIDLREKKEEYVRGGVHYERYRVKARLAKFFDTTRFPFSNADLAIQVEDGTHGVAALRYVAEEPSSGISRSGVPQGLKILKWLVSVRPHDYGSGRGDPRLSAGAADVHSRFVFAMLASPPSWELFVTMFRALFASVAIAFIVFFIKPIHVDPRFGLGVGAFFAAVGNNVFVGTSLPPTGRIALADIVNVIGLVTIFLTLVQSAISLYILDTMGRERLSRFFDKVSFAVFLIGYAVINLLLPLAAKP